MCHHYVWCGHILIALLHMSDCRCHYPVGLIDQRPIQALLIKNPVKLHLFHYQGCKVVGNASTSIILMFAVIRYSVILSNIASLPRNTYLLYSQEFIFTRAFADSGCYVNIMGILWHSCTRINKYMWAIDDNSMTSILLWSSPTGPTKVLCITHWHFDK